MASLDIASVVVPSDSYAGSGKRVAGHLLDLLILLCMLLKAENMKIAVGCGSVKSLSSMAFGIRSCDSFGGRQ